MNDQGVSHQTADAAAQSSPTVNSSPEIDEEVIDGGRITLSADHVSWKDRHESETAKTLAFALVATLVGSLVVHYTAITILMLNDQKEAVDVLTQVFDKWLPVISSFVGGAVTFYLTRRKG